MRSPLRLAYYFLISLTLGSLGCVSATRTNLTNVLDSDSPHAGQRPSHNRYLMTCPDRVLVEVQNRDDLLFDGMIRPDGRIDLGDPGAVRIEGLTPLGAAIELAHHLQVPADHVRVTVQEHRSRYIFLTGLVKDGQEAVPYEGPERIADFLRRSGGLKRGAALNRIHVVRSRIPEGETPQIFDIDLEAILQGEDQSSNIVLQAYDQVYVGQTRRSAVLSILPPWLKPMFKTACLFCPNPNALRLRP